MNKDQKTQQDQFLPLPNLPPGKTLGGRMIFSLRQIADLQVASVLLHLKPWLKKTTGQLLEVGCGAQPYRFLVPPACKYQALDWEGAQKYFQYKIPDTVYYDGKFFPFEPKSFDCLFHTEVLEHIWDYEGFLSECSRVLKPQGKMFFSVPFQARNHYIPQDYWRFTPAALERILGNCGFERIQITARGTDITVATYKCLSILYRWLTGPVIEKLFFILFLPFLLPLLLLGMASLHLRCGSEDDCLGYCIEAVKKE
jgi:SAM-dependent methyltransferase